MGRQSFKKRPRWGPSYLIAHSKSDYRTDWFNYVANASTVRSTNVNQLPIATSIFTFHIPRIHLTTPLLQHHSCLAPAVLHRGKGNFQHHSHLNKWTRTGWFKAIKSLAIQPCLCFTHILTSEACYCSSISSTPERIFFRFKDLQSIMFDQVPNSKFARGSL